MKKSKNRSEVSLPSVKSEIQHKEELFDPPLDSLDIDVLSLKIPNEDPTSYTIKITFFDQLLVSSVITSSSDLEDGDIKKSIASGQMNYDPSDYEKMCLFADNPLMVKIYQFKNVETNLSSDIISSTGQSQSNKSSAVFKQEMDMFCCNIDILPIFTGRSEMLIKKSMQSMTPLPILLEKSWDNLPLITLKIKLIKNKENEKHRKKFKAANFFKLTLIACYNCIVPFDVKLVYTAASKLPLSNEMQSSIFTYTNGYKIPKRFDSLSFYPHWESLRIQDEQFTKGDEKFQCNLTDINNKNNINLNYYMNSVANLYTTVWASFHRTTLLKDTEQWLSEHIRRFKWPFEFHIHGEEFGYSFMGFIDLFKLLYPGEKSTRLVVPLQWIDGEKMIEKCGCELLLTPNETGPSIAIQKRDKDVADIRSTNNGGTPHATGSDENCAFAIVEVTLARPFKKPIIPPHITHSEIKELLIEMESVAKKRECSGRGQLDGDWQSTVQAAANSLRRIPYYGTTDLCTINKQLSGSRTRVELVTSFCQEAAIYVNNNFVVKDFLQSDRAYEEMLTIAHACLMRVAHDTLVGGDSALDISGTLRAARHARQLQDLPHAIELYLQLIIENPREASSWRELATTLKDVDRDWAVVSVNKAFLMNPRHPLSILSKGCMIFEDDPDAAEPFFLALLALYPFSTTLWIAANAYFYHRELFLIADSIMEQVKMTKAEGLSNELPYPRAWERELGDWWDNTPLLPGTSLYYDAADLLLRIRAVTLAEVCIARALKETGVSPVYYHMVSLCCRLKGSVGDALCHVQQGIKKFGEISYLRSLEGECYHKRKDIASSIISFEKAGSCGSPYVVLLSLPRWDRDHQRIFSILSDLVRRHPCAYAWVAFAEYWIMRHTTDKDSAHHSNIEQQQTTAKTNATNCALKALNCDRKAGRAWALLADLLSPGARRQYCKDMAILCNYNKRFEDRIKSNLPENNSSHYRLGKVLRECRCNMCDIFSI